MTPFLGNPELKARLDVPGKLTVAGERMHDQLLRRFYTAHGYQTVWDSSPGRGEPPVECSSARRKAGSRPEPVPQLRAHRAWPTALSPIERDLLLSDAFLSYADALSRGAMPIEDRAMMRI